MLDTDGMRQAWQDGPGEKTKDNHSYHGEADERKLISIDLDGMIALCLVSAEGCFEDFQVIIKRNCTGSQRQDNQ